MDILQTECDAARINLHEEILVGQKLLLKYEIEFVGKGLKDTITMEVIESMSKLEIACDELEEINRQLSLSTQGTDKQDDFEKQMYLDFDLMNLAMDLHFALDHIRLAMKNIRLLDERSRRQEIDNICEKINTVQLLIPKEEESKIQQKPENLMTEHDQYQNYPKRQNRKRRRKTKSKANTGVIINKQGLLLKPKKRKKRKCKIGPVKPKTKCLHKKGGRKRSRGKSHYCFKGYRKSQSKHYVLGRVFWLKSSIFRGSSQKGKQRSHIYKRISGLSSRQRVIRTHRISEASRGATKSKHQQQRKKKRKKS